MVMKKKIKIWGIIGMLIGLYIFLLDEYIKYAEVNSFDNSCLDVFFGRLIILPLFGFISGSVLGYSLNVLFKYFKKKHINE
jgi:ABC-type transporter Mla maintaining outer membrane lipid asymmetry permease subunit MlaE